MGRGTVAAGDGGVAATSRHSTSVSASRCHLPMASPQGGLERQLTTPKPTQSHARCRFTASHAEIRHIAALISNWSTTPPPEKPNPIASSEPATNRKTGVRERGWQYV